MFTGIIETVGTVSGTNNRGNYRLLTVQPRKMFDKIELGESIAVDGCCLTVTEFDEGTFTAEASQESLSLTIIGGYDIGTKVNLERAMTPSSRLGGHFVQGHVDCIGKIIEISTVGESLVVGVEYAEEFKPYLVAKGSIAISGISLTVNELEGNRFWVNIIPHTSGNTTIESWKAGDKVNLEFDIIGKYIVRQLTAVKKNELTIDKLIEAGW